MAEILVLDLDRIGIPDVRNNAFANGLAISLLSAYG
jgi:hypothetical protein